MGFGDDIMATADAVALYRKNPVKVAIGKNKRFYWSPVFENNPILATPREVRGGNVQWLEHASGCRPYIDYEKTTPERWAFKKIGPLKPGYLDIERQSGEYVFIEPHIKAKASPNKQWGQWQGLVDITPVDFVQPDYGKPILDGVRSIPTRDFIDACRLLSGARAYVGPEGGLHHASAALGVPAVVIFGGFVSPEVTGYRAHRNLFKGEACGMRVRCSHCREIMASITPEDVRAELYELLEET